MIKTNVKNVLTTVPGITQASLLGVKESITTAPEIGSQLWTRSLVGSLTKDYLFPVGTGDLDPVAYARLFLQYAEVEGISMDTLLDDLRGYLQTFGFDTTRWLQLISTITGPGTKTVSQRSTAKITPTMLLTQIRNVAPADHEIFELLMTDYICSKLDSFGWILNDAPYEYRITRGQIFPTFTDLVNCVESLDLIRILNVLSNADISAVAEAVKDKNTGINPGTIAHSLASSVGSAYDIARGRYSSTAIVTSVLHLLGKTWTPNLPKDAEPSRRLLNSNGIEEMRANIGLFLAYQDMHRLSPDHEMDFSDEEMDTQVIPIFRDAILNSGIFKIRMPKDVTDHIGVDFSSNHMGQPGQIIMYESVNASTQMTAFVPVRQDKDAKRRFLAVDDAVSERLSAALSPVSDSLSLERLVEQTLTTYELDLASNRVPSNGAEMSLLLPTFYEREVSAGRSTDLLHSMIAGQPLKEVEEHVSASVKRATFDVYALLVHMACLHSRNAGIGVATGNKSTLVLVWDVATNLQIPVGQSAILAGSVKTTEPLEVIAYAPRLRPVEPLRIDPLNLVDHEHAIHVWKWYDSSAQVGYTQNYETTIRGQRYSVPIQDHQMLATSALRTRLRFMLPTHQRASAQLWFGGFLAEKKFVDDKIATVKDDLVKRAYEGRRLQNAIALVSRLIHISSGGIATRAEQIIKNALQDEMYSEGRIDDFAEVHVGIQQLYIRVWTGLATLEMLKIIDSEDVSEITTFINETNALALSVGTITYERQ